MLDLGALRSFVEVAERGTVAAAALARGYTPPAVSQHVAKLEQDLGAALFDRAGPRLRLTDAGRALVPIALAMVDLDETARTAVRRPEAVPHVVIAGFASAISMLLIPRLDRVRHLATVTIIEREDDEALRDLRLGAVDVVLTQQYDHLPAEHDTRLAPVPLATDALRLVLPPGSDPATRIEELGATPWLLNGVDTRCTASTQRLMRLAGIAPPVDGLIADNGTLLALVAAGRGVTIVPELVLQDRRAEVVVADQPLDARRTILAVHRRASATVVAPLLAELVLATEEAAPGAPRGTRRRTGPARPGPARRRGGPPPGSPSPA